MKDGRVRGTLAIAAGLVAFAVVLAIVDRLTPEPKGPPSSSYATAPAGLAAYASVLQRSGIPVRRLRTPVAKRAPRAGETLIVLDPDVLEPKEAQAIGAWVRAGGRLVAGGAEDASWLDAVLDAPPAWRPADAAARGTLVPVTETAGVRAVRAGGSWKDLGAALPAIGPPRAPFLVTAEAGRGSVALVADATPLQNRALARGDNAALGVALAAGRPVAFLETVHGYGVARGFGGLPAHVRWTLLGLALTALVAIWAVGRRFGPPEDPDTDPPPPRVAYVDALAAALARAKEEAR
ncbi:MAG TPA: DUF4350 domain-containing protein [Solirubrobacter sp.]|nr:DUF4350 domain-containing protein [Solirubrobacter sp.]